MNEKFSMAFERFSLNNDKVLQKINNNNEKAEELGKLKRIVNETFHLLIIY